MPAKTEKKAALHAFSEAKTKEIVTARAKANSSSSTLHEVSNLIKQLSKKFRPDLLTINLTEDNEGCCEEYLIEYPEVKLKATIETYTHQKINPTAIKNPSTAQTVNSLLANLNSNLIPLMQAQNEEKLEAILEFPLKLFVLCSKSSVFEIESDHEVQEYYLTFCDKPNRANVKILICVNQ